ncbi:MAG: inorganic pyrophosphatase [Fibrobacterota bacterium]
MGNKIVDPIVARLMGLRYKSHPWHGVSIGDQVPDVITAFIEMVTTDTVKYEVDKASGYLYLDRPQKYSNVVPAIYGFIPQTYSGSQVAQISRNKTEDKTIQGDGDPIDICILTEKSIVHGDIIVSAKPIGGFRMLDGNEADDKIVAVLNHDAVYGDYTDISDVPDMVIDRLRHYFLTYKDIPGQKRNVKITHTYGIKEAHEVIEKSMKDYDARFNNLENILSGH